jgi:hypothetical protein
MLVISNRQVNSMSSTCDILFGLCKYIFGRLVVVMGQDFVSALQPGGFLYYPRMKANVTE